MAAPKRPKSSKKETLADFRPQAKNTNKHTERGMAMLEQSIRECGFASPIVVTADNESIDGSARLETVYSLMPDDPIIIDSDGSRPVILRRTDLANAQDPRAVQLGILANRVAQANLEYDPEFLLEAEASGAIALTRFFDQDDLDCIFNAKEPEIIEPDDEDQVIEDIEEIQAGNSVSRVSPGEIWQIGRHRMLCGDSTDAAQVAILFAEEQADCCWTDPPYGVSYEGKTADKLTIENDKLAGGDLEDFLDKAFAVIANVAMKPGSPVYVAHPPGPLQIIFMTTFMNNLRFRQQLIWVKHHFALGRSDYHYRHEPILLGYTNGGEGRRGRGGDCWHGDNSQDSIFEVGKPHRSKEHPTMKPPKLIRAMLANSAAPRSLVFDPFLGSGSTMVAAQEMVGDRKVYGIEIDPVYAEVVLRRMERISGEEAQLIETIGG